MTLRVRNWQEFQHYKDRNPPWIKLHQDLLTSEQWVFGTDSQRVLLIAVMLLAARKDNVIPESPEYIQKVSHLDTKPDLEWLIETGFCERCSEDGSWSNPWASRHISDALRSEILSRDRNACVFCGADDPLEIDHVIPVSKGGDSNPKNLQTLCRSCNRKKRTRVANATRSVASATQPPPSAYIETEERRGEEETEGECTLPDDGFDAFWALYPRKTNKKRARTTWRNLTAANRETAHAALTDHVIYWSHTKRPTDKIPHASTWLNGECWEDELPATDLVGQHVGASDDWHGMWSREDEAKHSDHPRWTEYTDAMMDWQDAAPRPSFEAWVG